MKVTRLINDTDRINDLTTFTFLLLNFARTNTPTKATKIIARDDDKTAPTISNKKDKIERNKNKYFKYFLLDCQK